MPRNAEWMPEFSQAALSTSERGNEEESDLVAADSTQECDPAAVRRPGRTEVLTRMIGQAKSRFRPYGLT